MQVSVRPRAIRQIVLAAAIAAAGSFTLAAPAHAATFTYTASGVTADNWSTSPNWNAEPVSDPTTALIFGNGTTSAGTITSTNDIANPFQLNSLLINYNGSTAGTINISGSPLQFVSNGAVTPTLTINNTGTLPTVNINTALVLTNDLTLDAENAGNFTGLLTGAGNLTKIGAGIATVTAPGGDSRGVTIDAGSIALGFGGLSGTNNNIFGADSTLTIGGEYTASPATLRVTGSNNGNASSNTQTFASTTFTTGRSSVSAATGRAGKNTVVLNLDALVRTQPAALADFAVSTATITTTTGNDASGILGGWATTGTAFAANNGSGNIVAYTGYTVSTSTIANAPNANVQVDSTTTGSVTLAGTGTTTVNTLSIPDVNAGRDITIGAGNTLRLGATGVIWRNVASTVATTFTTTGGSITAGGADNTAGELILRADGAVNTGVSPNTQAFNVISSTIVDNGTGAVTVIKNGAQGITLNNLNTYSGDTYIFQGTLQSTQSQGFGSGVVHVADGAQAFASGTTYANNFDLVGSGPNVAFNTISASLGALRLGVGSTVTGQITLESDARIDSATNLAGLNAGGTITGKITGPGGLFVGANGQEPNNLTLSNSTDDYDGDTTITLGGVSSGAGLSVLNLGAPDVIPNGAGKGNVIFTYPGNQTTAITLNGNNETINGLSSNISGISTDANRVIRNNSTTAASFTLGDNNASANFLGQITNGTVTSPAVEAPLALSKIGSGTQTLGGRTTYTGATTITAGTLNLDYNQFATSQTSAPSNYFSTNSDVVLAGGTLAISGRNNGADISDSNVSLAKGTTTFTLSLAEASELVVGQAIAATTNIKTNTYIVAIFGNTIVINQGTTNTGTVTDTVATSATSGSTSQSFKSLALTANSTLDFGNGGSGNTTVIHFTGAIANNGSTLTIANWNGIPDTGNGTEQLLFTGADASAFTSQFSPSQVVFDGFAPGYTTIQEGANFEVVPSTAPVPEPASLAMLGLGAAALLTRRRRA